MTWVIGLVANVIIAAAYFAIVLAIVRPLIKSGQLRSNPLGAATAAIFFTCAVHHGTHSVHMLMPVFGVDLETGMAMREAWTWQLAIWDIVGAAVGVYYWTLRRSYSSLMEGAQLFADIRARERQAFELNDNVLQGLVVAKMAIEVGDTERADDALTRSIDSASEMITGLLRGADDDTAGLLRRSAAVLRGGPPESSQPEHTGQPS